MKPCLLATVVVCLAVSVVRGDGVATPPAPLTYEQYVRPILKAHCFTCHGEGPKLRGGLDVRLRRLLVKGGKQGPVIVPGRREESLLYQRVSKGEMPPDDNKLSPKEVAVIGRWIANGALTARPEPLTGAMDSGITPEDRAFWSFQPIHRPEPPSVPAADRVRTPIDAFLAAKLQEKGLSFAPDADKRTLLLRAYFDLTGLPPTPDETARFLADSSPDAYERLIECLLASPHYGERWGRHWLDIAGYADSDGYTDADMVRPYAYHYRDYVIRSFNADKPFDRFIREQLAGDELLAQSAPYPAEATAKAANAPPAPRAGGTVKEGRRSRRSDPPSIRLASVTPDAIEKLAATGFLRMGADGTAARGVDFPTASNQAVAEAIKILSTSLLGVSVGCAQCHDHRYDPILQSDYYRLRAILEPAYDWKHWRTPPQRLLSLYSDADRAKAAQVEAEAARVAGERAAKEAKYMAAAFETVLATFPEPQQAKLKTAFQTAAGKRTAEQQKLVKENPKLSFSPGQLYQYNPKAAEELKQYDYRIKEIRAKKPAEDFLQVLTEVPGQVPTTYLFHRGDYQQPKEAIAPGDLTVCVPTVGQAPIPVKANGLPTTGRRLAYANWLTSGKHPLVARVLVNRVWMHHFGRGIVGTPADFGSLGERPTHPELLDWLASDFMANGWQLKRLHRLLMTSTAYRQSSRSDPASVAADPEGRLYSRMAVRRLEAEAIRDRILATSGVLNPKLHGPAVPVREDAVGQIIVGREQKRDSNQPGPIVSLGAEEFRRSVYIQVRRTQPLALLKAFDAPVMETNCDRRPVSTAATQALMLMNSDFALEQASRFASRLRKETGTDLSQQVDCAWRLAFARPPTDVERKQSLDFLTRQTETVAKPQAAKTAGKTDPALQALTSFCQVLLSSNEFLYVD